MRTSRFFVLLVSIVALLGLGTEAFAGNGSNQGQRDPLDAADIRTAGAANNFVAEHFPGTYGGYWVRPMARQGPFTFYFAWTRGLDTRLETLNDRFPLNRGTYVVRKNEHTWAYLLSLQRRVGQLLVRIRNGEVKAPGKDPAGISSYPEPERDCLMLLKGPLEKSAKKWWKHRFGDSICMKQAFVGPSSSSAGPLAVYEKDHETAARAWAYAAKTWPREYSGVWVLKRDRLDHDYVFAFTAKSGKRVARLRKLFPTVKARYIPARRAYSEKYLLGLLSQVIVDRQRIDQGILKPPGRDPGEFDIGENIRKSRVTVFKPFFDPGYKEWFLERYGKAIEFKVSGLASW